MEKIGFDNDLYIAMQSAHIRERIEKFGGKLYLEFGGKLFDDFHAARVLPGFEPDSKIRMLMELRDEAEIVIVISADDIERNKRRGDLGITYDVEVLRLIDTFREIGLCVGSVVLTQSATGAEGVAGKFPAFGQHIISAGTLCLQTKQADRFGDDRKLPVQVVFGLGDQESKVKIAQIMEYSAAAGEPTGQKTALLLEQGGSTFFPCILILADDHSILILPKEEDASILFHGFHQILLGSKIQVGIETVTFVQFDPIYHAW